MADSSPPGQPVGGSPADTGHRQPWTSSSSHGLDEDKVSLQLPQQLLIPWECGPACQGHPWWGAGAVRRTPPQAASSFPAPATAAAADVTLPEPAAILGTAKSLAQLVCWQQERGGKGGCGDAALPAVTPPCHGLVAVAHRHRQVCASACACRSGAPRAWVNGHGCKSSHPSSSPLWLLFLFLILFHSPGRRRPTWAAERWQKPPRCLRLHFQRGRKAISWQQNQQRAPHGNATDSPTGNGVPGGALGIRPFPCVLPLALPLV